MKFDVTIIGAGIVGLSTAYQLSKKNPRLKIAILEKEKEATMHQTGNNSGVIHSGVYYTPRSQKSLNCINGYQLLLSFCEENNLSYELCGKIIVATEKKEIPILENIYQKGIKNGLKDLKYLDESGINEIEPHATGIKAVHVPQAGIISYKKVANKIVEKLKKENVELFFSFQLEKIEEREDMFYLSNKDKTIQTNRIIACAGLYADKVAEDFMKKSLGMKILPFRGEYYDVVPEKNHLVRGLIYPVPNPDFPFLGVHFTKKIEGGVEAGPNAVLAFAREGYHKSNIHVKELMETLTYSGFRKLASEYWNEGWIEMKRSFSKKLFTRSLQKLIPEIQEKDLVKGKSGVRATLCDDAGNLFDDYVILQNKNSIHVLNAPSPAATSCLSIGDRISDMMLETIK